MASTPNIPIDPELLNEEASGPSRPRDTVSPLVPQINNGVVLTSKVDFAQTLESTRVKKPLQDALSALRQASVPKSWNLDRLRKEILDHWYPQSPPHNDSAREPPIVANAQSYTTRPPPPPPPPPPSSSLQSPASRDLAFLETRRDELPFVLTQHEDITPDSISLQAFQSANDDEVSLVQEFGGAVPEAHADEVLGFDDEDEEDEENGVDRDREDDEGEEDLDEDFAAYQTQVRLDAVQRSEQTRRAGGIKTQAAMVRLWEEFKVIALADGRIKDDIVDEHSILLCIKHHAERPKRTRRGAEIPGTFIGASQLKKLFFALLRIRKQQDAQDPDLAISRRATSVVVWDEIKARMEIALQRSHRGLVPGEDAPDITANTFLAEVTDEQLDSIGKGFLAHRELRSVIYGHLTWTAQNASGNRGDDIRALKLAELQPWTMLHMNGSTQIPCVLALQSEEKAGKRGMRCVINPVYTVFIAHREAQLCPLGAIAILLHYLHDYKHLADIESIDWSLNSSWRMVRLLAGQKSLVTPLSDASLYNLYVRAFAAAGFSSRIKAHLPRHLLGFKQEAMGVDPMDTSQLGWVRGQTYFDTYRPSIAKAAVLGAHGYKSYKAYGPVWRDIHVPEQFLKLVCPMAEEILETVNGRPNLTGTANHWKMVIQLRPLLFQCGAELYKRNPTSAMFRLPAFSNRDVRTWMGTTYRDELVLLRAAHGSLTPLEQEPLQNAIIQRALDDLRAATHMTASETRRLRVDFERRTAAMSPTQGFSTAWYASSAHLVSLPPSTPSPPALEYAPSHQRDNSGSMYRREDGTLRAFANGSPDGNVGSARAPTQVDLIIPSNVAAFYMPGCPQGIWPPSFGQKSVTWPTIFNLIKQPYLCWNDWKPSKTLNQYSSVSELWEIYTVGEPKVKDGVQIGIGPPLRDVEAFFQHAWRTGGEKSQKKTWQRFREIPEWIQHQSTSRLVSPKAVIDELEQLRVIPIPNSSKTSLMGLRALSDEVANRRKVLATVRPATPPPPITHDQPSNLGSPFAGRAPSTENARKRSAPVAPRIRAKKMCR